MCGFRRFTGFLQLRFLPKNQQKINRAGKINGFTNSFPAAVKCKNIYVPIRPGAVPLVSKTNNVILLSLFCCLLILCRLVFIFSMAQCNSAAQCQTGRNSTNPGESKKFRLKMCKIVCFLGVGSSALLRAAVSSLVLSVGACCGWCMVFRWWCSVSNSLEKSIKNPF